MTNIIDRTPVGVIHDANSTFYLQCLGGRGPEIWHRLGNQNLFSRPVWLRGQFHINEWKPDRSFHCGWSRHSAARLEFRHRDPDRGVWNLAIGQAFKIRFFPRRRLRRRTPGVFDWKSTPASTTETPTSFKSPSEIELALKLIIGNEKYRQEESIYSKSTRSPVTNAWTKPPASGDSFNAAYQRFFTAPALLPGNAWAIIDHRFPTCFCFCTIIWSSQGSKGSRLRAGERRFCHLSLHCLAVRQGTNFAILTHCVGPNCWTAWRRSASSCCAQEPRTAISGR